MIRTEIIRNALEIDTHLEFTVMQKEGAIYIYEDAQRHKSFYLKVTTNEARRLTIICEPDKNGVQFVETLNKSTKEQREVFCKVWDKINALNAKMEISLNGNNVSSNEFLSFKDGWEKLLVRFTKIPYYEDLDDEVEKLISYIELICEMLLSLCTIEYEGNAEGNEEYIISKRYERNPINRKMCIMLKGCRCAVCGFDFHKVYGDIGKNFIEVHHKTPISMMGENYHVDPSKDLIPLCSNCHSMIHRKNPPYTPEELVSMIRED